MNQINAGRTPNKREMLLLETMNATPQELHSFVLQAFTLFDEEVKKRQRSYQQVQMQDMRNIALNLCARQSTIRPPVMLHASNAFGAPPPSSSVASEAWKRSSSTQPFSTNPTATARQYSTTLGRKRSRFAAESHEADQDRFQMISRGSSSPRNDGGSFTGHSRDLERKYSRDAPTPEDIRPLPYLLRAFEHISAQAKRREKVEGRNAALKYYSEQLKGMRQDLRVQDITNDFTVKVYETHARISLEVGDMGEFNQCQAALKHLYMSPTVDRSKCSIADFFCYRLVYLSLGQQFDALSTELVYYTNLHLKRKEMKSIVHHIPKSVVQSALRLAHACDNGDIFTINAVLQNFSEEMRYLLRMFLQRRRVLWLNALVSGVKGQVSIRYVLAALGFLPTTHVSQDGESTNIIWLDSTPEESEQEAREFFSIIKLSLPDQFSVVGVNNGEFSSSIDAEETKRIVDEYIRYLNTRRDAATPLSS